MAAHPIRHPTDETLQSYSLGKLDDILAEAVAQHLDECPDCRRRVSEMSSDSFLGRLRGARGGPAMSSTGRAGVEDRTVHLVVTASAMPPVNSLPSGLADHTEYRVVRELGRGGMGVVYLAENTLMGRMEVLKVMGGR